MVFVTFEKTITLSISLRLRVARRHVQGRGQSILRIKPVIAIANSGIMSRMLRDRIPLGDSNEMLFKRDRQICAYCAQTFPRHMLSRDHVVPRSRGGADTWENCVTSCKECNSAKGAKSVDEFRPLVYVPYAPATRSSS